MSVWQLVRGRGLIASLSAQRNHFIARGSAFQPIRSLSGRPTVFMQRDYVDIRPGVFNAMMTEEALLSNTTTSTAANTALGGSTDFEVIFLGTSSSIPSHTRNTSSLAVRFQSVQWLVDCGEGTQRQISASIVQGKRITNIFITHLHGDHCFGLPGVLCMIGKDLFETQAHVVDVYGPPGLRDYLRVVMQNVRARVCARYRVHELHGLPSRRSASIPSVAIPADASYGEVDGGRNIFPNQQLEYDLGMIDGAQVYAASMMHTIPCVGYVFQEPRSLGRLRVEDVEPLIERNKEALPALINHRDYKYTYRILKALASEAIFTFPDGTVVTGASILDPPRRGRKLVVMGDTNSGKYIANLARDADVLIHEATNSYFNDLDCGIVEEKFRSYEELEKHTCEHGHSTPDMAGAFAARINAKQLILTHFSSRYSTGRRVMSLIENMAINTFRPPNKHDVIAAYDHMGYIIRRPRDSDRYLD